MLLIEGTELHSSVEVQHHLALLRVSASFDALQAVHPAIHCQGDLVGHISFELLHFVGHFAVKR